ncbi:universal stress protein [Plantibacter sp. ME-Dv--P-122b]|uniref:universal stress protein n=1 Tax=Plantibacter sp. ME-Dv--P-122b TaxID=3040300 RepID=UPI00254EAEFE|nr:universal stress protein [Plantibacter sp. ME-Dv--P-122b]
MTEHTLVGWDGSPAARRAAEWATHRALATGEPITLIQVVAPGPAGADDVTLIRAVESAEDEAISIRHRYPVLDVRSEVLVGEALADLRACSDEHRLLVVGTDDLGTTTRTSGWSLGSRLAASCSGPVAVIPQLGAGERHGVVLGIENREEDESAIELAAREAIAREEPLHVVHAWHQAPAAGARGLNPEFIAWLGDAHETALSEAVERIERDFPEVSLQQHLSEGRPADALHAFAGSATALVVGTRGRGAVLRFFLGSTSHQLLLTIDAPTIVVPRRPVSVPDDETAR